ncbi:MAG: hypothetical protein Q9207_006031 [Kuettlingeria erythrocarpa]
MASSDVRINEQPQLLAPESFRPPCHAAAVSFAFALWISSRGLTSSSFPSGRLLPLPSLTSFAIGLLDRSYIPTGISYFIFKDFDDVLYDEIRGVKACYTPDGASTADFPCNPEAEVSACCGGGWICRTNLFCENASGIGVVGSCTNRNWASNDPACPFPLSTYPFILRLASTRRIDLDGPLDWINTTANYDHFDYKLNTTICSDATVCPNNFFSSSNTTCCDDHKGIQEINYQNNAFLPDAASDLPDYYSSANLVIPTDGVYKTATYSTYTATTRSIPAASQAAQTPLTLAPTPAVTPAPAPTPAPTPAPASSSDLSSGAKAGIGIGAAAGALAIAGLAIIFWTRRRKTLQRRSTDTNIAPKHNEYQGLPTTFKGELPADREVMRRQELAGEYEPKRQTHEMQA